MADQPDQPKTFSREAGGDGCEIRVICEPAPKEPAQCYERTVGGDGCELTVISHHAHDTDERPGQRAPVYPSNESLPQDIREQLSPLLQTLYREAYNKAWDKHVMPLRRGLTASHDAAATRAAWLAIRRQYTQVGTTWIRRGVA